jgi:hypothetical protein
VRCHAAFEGYEPVQQAIANAGRIFTVQRFQQLFDDIEDDDTLADKQAVRDGLAMAFESGRVRTVRPPSQRLGSARSRVRKLPNPVNGADDLCEYKAPGPRMPARMKSVTVSSDALPVASACSSSDSHVLRDSPETLCLSRCSLPLGAGAASTAGLKLTKLSAGPK